MSALPILRRRGQTDTDPLAAAERGAELARLAAETAAANAERSRIEVETRIALARLERDAAREDAERHATARHGKRQARRAERAARLRALLARLRPVAPLVVVNAAAMYGQIGAGYEYLTSDSTSVPAKLAVAVLVASAAELIAVYVGWHAHDALLRGDGRTAGRLRRASYLLAAVIGAVNYSHFAGDGFTPTWAAVVFALFSAASPWLWGLHTRRAQHVQLTAEGRADTAGTVFSGERVRAFPWRSWHARRWSIDHGVNDPIEAWEGYRAERTARRAGERECGCGLPGVPSRAERESMAPAEVRDSARRTYLTAVSAGLAVTDRQLAEAYGMRDRWARERIREARADRTEEGSGQR